MKIGFDARCLEEERISGVGEYAFEVLVNILKIDQQNQYVVFSNSFKHKNNRHFDRLKEFHNVELKRFSFPNKILNFCFWYFGYPSIDRLIGGVDVFFAPNINFLSTSRNCAFLTTFHDLSFERTPSFFSLKTRLWHRYFVNPRKIALTSEKIIAISESTKKDLQEIYRIDGKKIEVIYHGVSSEFKTIDSNDPTLDKVRKKYDLPEKFVLYLGNIDSRKNIRSILSAYDKISLQNPNLSNHKLVLAGNMSRRYKNLTSSKSIKICGYIDREDRPYVYNLASLFVFPSFFEGFGLPILESMACGTPVVTSHNSSLPEVAGNAAILIDPNRPDQIFEAMQSLLCDKKLYDEIRKRGLTQANKFFWRKCASKTLGVLCNT